MKKFHLVSVLLVVLLFLLVLVGCVGVVPEPTVSPLPIPPSGTPVPDVQPIEDYIGAVGIGALITLLVQILKALSIVPDGKAGWLATALNVVVFAVLWVAGAFGFDVTGSAIQDVLAMLEQFGKLILMIVTSPVFFKVLRSAQMLPAPEQ